MWIFLELNIHSNNFFIHVLISNDYHNIVLLLFINDIVLDIIRRMVAFDKASDLI